MSCSELGVLREEGEAASRGRRKASLGAVDVYHHTLRLQEELKD